VIKHAEATRVFIVPYHAWRNQEDGTMEATATTDTARKPKRTYRQEWAEYNQAQTNEKARFQELLYALCQGVEELPRKGRAGRNRYPLGDMMFCAASKVYECMSGRRTMSDLKEAQRRGLIRQTPHYNSVFNYFEMKELTPYLKEMIRVSSLPLKSIESDFAADSSGFRVKGYVTWFNAKYGKEVENHDWIKMHLMCGVKTNIVTAVEMSGRHANDSPYLKPLLNETAASGFEIREVSADKGYISANNLRLVLLKGAIPYIPFKENHTTNGKSTVWNRMLHFYRYHEDEFNTHYHKRSNVESTFWMIKSKFGEQIRSKSERAQINEALCKVLCHNICCVIQSIYELGLEANFWAESLVAQKSPPFP
jgi:transposase